jgi:hypothetical protein
VDGVDRSLELVRSGTTRFEDLAAALRAHARGLCHAEAAVELLIGHQHWLRRGEFVGRFVWIGRAMVGDRLLAVVEWPAAVAALAAGRLPCSDSERHVLRVAASIAKGVPVDLKECLSTLDCESAGLVAQAVLRAAGRRGGQPR